MIEIFVIGFVGLSLVVASVLVGITIVGTVEMLVKEARLHGEFEAIMKQLERTNKVKEI